MPSNKLLRFLLYAIASWLVVSLAMVTFSFLFKTFQRTQQPGVSSIIRGLKSTELSERKQALDKVNYKNWSDPRLIAAASEMVLVETDPQLKTQAITRALQGYVNYTKLTRVQISSMAKPPALTLDKIDKISNLVLEEPANSYQDLIHYQLYQALYQFLQYTVNAQADPVRYVAHLTKVLRNLADAEKGTFRNAKMIDTLLALRGYAAYQVLPDETMTTLLAVYRNQAIHVGQAPDEILKVWDVQASKVEFRKDLLDTIETTAVKNEDKDLRLTAVSVLAQQSLLTGRLSSALEQAVNDKDTWIANVASSSVAKFKKAQGEAAGNGSTALAVVALDTTQTPRVRAAALHGGIVYKSGKYSIEPTFLDVAETLLSDPAPEVRAASLYYLKFMWNLARYQQHHDQLQAWLEAGLHDKDASVRSAAINLLETIPDDDTIRSRYVVDGLKDPNRRVVQEAIRIMQLKKLNTSAIVEQVNRLAESDDPSVRGPVERYKEKLDTHNRTVLQNVRHVFSNPNNMGGFLYVAAAALALLFAFGFGLFYAYRLIAQLSKKPLRAALAFGVLLGWIGLSYALTAAFVFGIFGMGHNVPAPMREQLVISGMLIGLTFGYGVIGYLLYLVLRESKQPKAPLPG